MGKIRENLKKFAKITRNWCVLDSDRATPLREWSMPERLDNFEFLVLSFELRSPPSLKLRRDKPADFQFDGLGPRQQAKNS